MRFSKVVAFFCSITLAFAFIPFAQADWVWSPEQGKFVSTDEGGQDDAQDMFEQALELFREKRLDKSAEQFELILKKYPKSQIAPEAQYRLGTIYEEKGDLAKAHKAYQALLKSYPQSERFEEVVEREYELGNAFLSGEKGMMFGLKIRPSFPIAIEIFKNIVEVAPFSSFGDKAQFQLGNAYLKSAQYDNAIEAFQELIDLYPKSLLVQDARLQMAEVSYAKARVETRDQSVLDEASQQADRYLKRYGTAPEAEKAARIRQEVDEKNAEKNCRIGIYYEKENYLDSALIYYRDTAKRYPDTVWGKKAADKLKSLEQPVTYLSAKEEDLKGRIAKLEDEFRGLGKDDKAKREEIESEIKGLKKQLHSIGDTRSDALDRRREDLKRRERELKEKFKEFERKKKRYKDNTSPDFQKALDRWLASLEAERDAISEEKDQLADWRAELGVPAEPFYQHMLSFMKPEPPIEKVRQAGEKDLYKLSKKKKELFQKKEKLYKRYTELQTYLAPQLTETGLEIKRLRGAERKVISEKSSDQLTPREKQIRELEKQLDEKLAVYEKNFGKMAEQELEAMLARQAGESVPSAVHFDSGGDLQVKSLDELLAFKMHLGEKIAAQQTIVDTLTHAFNRELVIREQAEMIKSLSEREETDLNDLRKQIKSVEKDIRRRYQDIQDRHAHKKRLVDELEDTLHGQDKTVWKTVAKPVTGTLYLTRAFLFGLPNKDVELNKEAKKNQEMKAGDLQRQIEMESLMIDAQNVEITRLEKEHEILTAKASLAGGYKFRGSFVKVPYVFIDEAVQSAKRIVPRRERKDVLLNRLDMQSRELEASKKRLEEVQAAIGSKSSPAVPVAQAADPEASSAGTSSAVSYEKTLRDDITGLFEQIEVQYSMYAEEQGMITEDYRARLETEMKSDHADKERAKRYNELKETEADLVKVIGEELKLEDEERQILIKRQQEIEKLMPEADSRAMTQDMLTEKGRVEQRLADLEIRKDFLMNEQARYAQKLS